MNPADDVARERVLKGIPASPGIAVGRAFVLSVESPTIRHERISPNEVDAELARFAIAIDVSTRELYKAVEIARTEKGTVTSIIESFIHIVNDPTITASIVDRIRHGYAAEWAVIAEYDTHKSLLYAARDAVMRERAQDLEHVKERLLAAMRNRQLSHESAAGAAVVAGSVTPQDMLFFRQNQTLGFVTEVGGINSHTCILARDLGIPAVIGVRNATTVIPTAAPMIVDGYSGVIIVYPTAETRAEYESKLHQAEEYRQRLGELRDQSSTTVDGVHVALLANIDTPDDVDTAMMQGCEGIGLVRTEVMLAQHGRYPSMEEQTSWYTDIAERAFPQPVTFRAFDVGSDKFREGIPHHEDNPALGLRGIRFLLYRPDIFAQQIFAVLRASAHRNVRFMLPMVSVYEELQQAKEIIEACRQALIAEGVDFDRAMPVGVMIETPAAALLADVFASETDFLSIGTNDLAQYALATDRTNELVADIFDASHPAVLRMIRMIVDAADAHGRTVSVCGELAGHAAATEMLVGLGIRELSVAPRLVLEVKQRVRATQYADARQLVEKLLRCTSTLGVHALLTEGR
ncbi:MAG: phosphoenolpyruvate--protein phosphotransferase [Candidatus Kapabacteria bacterium]|nr:phosphoenolpyruvate--protein phosphotransferase [Candidatus Kapabacteria bacterium]